MSSEIAISVHNLSKCYQIYDKPHDRLKQFIFPRLQRLAGFPSNNYYKEFWALKDVSFEIKIGETVGIVGRNGSGKSTLLQIICGTLNPTGGIMQTHGRIAALLELGSGFNPEFTGRENIYMNAAVLGLSKEETSGRFDDIAAFADIGDFIDQPVKAYSSGMVVRLAFAVAINVDPQILVVDEALSVGDELFQRKCFSRLEAIRASGATILFVSHSGGTVVELCDRAILLDLGERLAIGPPKQIVGRYQKLLYVPEEKRGAVRDEIRRAGVTKTSITSDTKTNGFSIPTTEVARPFSELNESYDPDLRPSSTITYESHGAVIEDPGVYTADGERANNLIRGRSYRYRYRVRFERTASNVRFGMMLKTTSGIELGGGVSAGSTRNSLPFVEVGSLFDVEFRFECRLNPGVFFLNAGVVGELNGSEIFLHRLVDVAMFRVLTETESLVTGIIDLACQPLVTKVNYKEMMQ